MESQRREFDFTEADFRRLQALVRANSGIALSENKRDLVYSRLAKRVRKLGLESFKDYVDFIEGGSDEELAEFTNAMTTNVTSFLRESYHFDLLCDSLLPRLVTSRGPRQPIRVWSSACSSGQEPYTIAMSALARVPDIDKADFKILATDLDSKMVETGKQGVYDESVAEPLPPEWRRRFLLRGKGPNGGKYRVRPEVRALISFKQLNLMQAWPMRGPLDAIFCRNVMIYFDLDTQISLVERFRQLLPVGGVLFLGHSETMPKECTGWELVARTTFQRIA